MYLYITLYIPIAYSYEYCITVVLTISFNNAPFTQKKSV